MSSKISIIFYVLGGFGRCLQSRSVCWIEITLTVRNLNLFFIYLFTGFALISFMVSLKKVNWNIAYAKDF